MKESEISTVLAAQKQYFQSGHTLPLAARDKALTLLYCLIQSHTEEIAAALRADLGKSKSESYMCEIGLVLSEISYLRKNLRRFAGSRRVPTPLTLFAAKSITQPVPYGTVLIVSPWNYPFLLSMEPLADALAAGNTCVLKPSAYSPTVSALLARLLSECFDPRLITVVTGGREENTCLLRQSFDFIFFTGSQAVGKEVLRQAANHLTPVVLELGGKSPCIVDASANIRLAAKRIVFGKFLNCGQTCVAPDYVYCHESVKEEFLAAIKAEIHRQFGEQPLSRETYGKMINRKHFDRVLSLIDPRHVICGGASDAAALRIEPTVLDGITWEDSVMQEEIFGPVLPVLSFTSFADVIREINRHPEPLAAYLFSEDKKQIRTFTVRCTFGGGCINDTVIHLTTPHMGFGGVGASGMGSYHGKAGFDTFSHTKSIVDQKNWLDLPIRYQPYNKLRDAMVRLFLK